MIGFTRKSFFDKLILLKIKFRLFNHLKMKLLQKRKLLNSYESILSAYILMFFSLISSRYKYLDCINCGLNYQFVVSTLYSIVFLSHQILTLNAFFNKQRYQIRFFYFLFLPLVIYLPISISNFYRFFKAAIGLFLENIVKILNNI